jgi:ribosomal protein S12 methylthiotransferase accessory factor
MLIRDYKRNEFRRTDSAENTIKRIKSGLDSLGLEEKVTTFKNSECLWTSRIFVDEIRIAANGKGISEELSLASAYAELVERFSAGMEPEIKLSPFRSLHGNDGKILEDITNFRYMRGYKWLHQDSVDNTISVESFLKRLNFTKGQFEYAKLNSELLKHWIPGYSLIQKREVLVPILFVRWISSTNGLASGNTIEEAIIQGACEIFERDAMIRFLNSKDGVESYPNILHDSIDNSTIQKILKYFNQNNIDVFIKDIGNSLYPVYSILTFNNNIEKNLLNYNTMKAGSSFDSDEAIIRCFTERMQGTSISKELVDSENSSEELLDGKMLLFFKGICPINLDNLKGNDYISYEKRVINSTKQEINKCIEIVKDLGTDLIIVNHTHPVIKFPTIRVIIPGVSDFMQWWSTDHLNMNFICKIQDEEDKYEKSLIRILKTFYNKVK